MYKLIMSVLLMGVTIVSIGQQIQPLGKDPKIEERVEKILEQMSLEEMAQMLSGLGFTTKANERLGIPSLVMVDGPVGPLIGKSTNFSSNISMAATWNDSLVYAIGEAMGEETKAKNQNTLLAPNINIHRVPFAGRNYETFGEDPYLAGEMAVNFIQGLQSQGVAASVKHFVANSQEYERKKVDAKISKRALEEIYFPAFKKAVQEGNSMTVMSAYNRINGQYASSNTWLMTDVLKDRWGFQGLVMSDWGAVHSTIPTLYAGLDLEMPLPEYLTSDKVLKIIEEDMILRDKVEDKVRRMLRVMMTLGLFDEEPWTTYSSYDTTGHARLALQTSRESIVLMKNDQSFLPLAKDEVKNLAVIGALADRGGTRRVFSPYEVSPLQGIKNLVGDELEVSHTTGYNMKEDGKFVTSEDFTTMDGRPGFELQFYDNLQLEGNPVATVMEDRLSEGYSVMPPVPEIEDDNYSIRVKGQLTAPRSGWYKFSVTMAFSKMRFFLDGKQMLDNWDTFGEKEDRLWVQQFDSLYLEGGKSVPCVLEYQSKSGSYNHFNFKWKYLEESPLKKAMKLAKKSDAVILCLGYSSYMEEEETDRKYITLPPDQLELLDALIKQKVKLIVVTAAGAAIDFQGRDQHISSLIHTWHPGQEGGTALAEIIFGEVNPSGKLPTTFMKQWKDSPSYGYYPGEPNGVLEYKEDIYVGYRYYDRADTPNALFAFGHGLSYTDFEYGPIELSKGQVSGDEQIALSIKIKNTGDRAGAEVVQLYVGDDKSTLDRPVKELKRYQKVTLSPGEEKVLSFQLKKEDLSFYSPVSESWEVEPGQFTLYLGSSIQDIRRTTKLFYQ